MSSDPNHSPENAADPNRDAAQQPPADVQAQAETGSPAPNSAAEESRKPKIKIGSQRPGAPIPRIEPRIKIAMTSDEAGRAASSEPAGQRPLQAELAKSEVRAQVSIAPAPNDAAEEPQLASAQMRTDTGAAPPANVPRSAEPAAGGKKKPPRELPPQRTAKVEVPNLRAELPPDLNQEMEEALGGMSVDELIESEAGVKAAPKQLEPETRYNSRVVRVHRDNVFVEIAGHNLGVVPLKNFDNPPEVGTILEVTVNRFNADEGFYELLLPHGAVNVADWADIAEGMIVEARVTGHNKGGLECEVNRLRGFIPASQVSIYRVEDLEQFVGQKFACVVTEANPEKRNLVLSRRGVLEREQAEAKQKLLAELAPGQTREGTVRSLRDFGAFVDLGGVDGLIHVSQISWDRIKHPEEVLKVGQRVKVKIQKIDPDTGKIGLTYRDLMESPWENVAQKYPVTSRVTGTVSRIMDFGAFVRLEPGVEGLVHISELAHRRVFRASDIVQEGQQVEAKVLSVDAEGQRISLSMKALESRPTPAKKEEPEPEEPETPEPPRKERKTPLKGGLGRSQGERFGLKW